MSRVRVAGPRSRLDAVLAALQDLGVLHVDAPHVPVSMSGDAGTGPRERKHLERCLVDVETACARLEIAPDGETIAQAAGGPARGDVRRARHLRRRVDGLHFAEARLDDERVLLLRYREFFEAFGGLVGHELAWPDGQAFYVVLRAGAGAAADELRRRLETAVNGEVEVLRRELSSGEWAVLILVSAQAAPKVGALLSASRVDELPTPAGLGHVSLLGAMPALTARLAAIPGEIERCRAERRTLAGANAPWLRGLRRALHDGLLRLEARGRVLAAQHLFVIEGWLPERRVASLAERLQITCGPEVVVTVIGAEPWAAVNAPVALRNPPLFEPFEVLTRTLPLPRYGTIDPTPFVAVFFPAFFGLMLGDIGYGLGLGALAIVLRAQSLPGSTLRAVSTVALACSSSAVAFGVLFGEFLGSLGPVVGLQPFFDREEATTSFLLLAIALGVVHILLGLLLGAMGSWRQGHAREAMGRSVMLTMLLLTALALLAAFEVLPVALFSPLVIAVLVAFPILIALEGLVAVVELLSAFGHVLSYARIMALGTASLMLAIVANEMVGAMGSVLVGVLFALLFHLVNFAIGLFSPTIHALRLHYVEFFGRFVSPGGVAYRPLARWQPSA